ncbi:hypothetical protein [Streptomyces virginiae]
MRQVGRLTDAPKPRPSLLATCIPSSKAWPVNLSRTFRSSVTSRSRCPGA